MADNNDCWGAFGSDSDSDDDRQDQELNLDAFVPAADATALMITQHFVSMSKSSGVLLPKSTGVLLKERVVGIATTSSSSGSGMHDIDNNKMDIMKERIIGRGMKIVGVEQQGKGTSTSTATDSSQFCDGAILLQTNSNMDDKQSISSECIDRALLPGGHLWLILSSLDANEVAHADTDTDDGTNISIKQRLEKHYSNAVWDLESASEVYSSTQFQVISVQKRACVINQWSCPWMDKTQRITSQLPATIDKLFTINHSDTYLDYERKVASAVTVCPSVAERTRRKVLLMDGTEEFATVLTDANVARATAILQQHGFVVIKGLLSPTQTIPWGNAVLSDFGLACSRLKNHPTRPVDLLNPHASTNTTTSEAEEHIFEPLSYKEMAMREDLRVDLRSGPAMEELRCKQNDVAFQSMAQQVEGHESNSTMGADRNNGPSIINSECTGTVSSWRFHPSILAIIKATFNPRDDTLSRGNFGRWNFGGTGPDGSPQPFRLGQVGSVLSCPGSGDQAIHADTPHLFEHIDCLPCHYMNIFTPGYNICEDPNSDYYQNEFDGGVWTGNSTIGGTALVLGSHRLSVTTQLLSEDVGAGNDATISSDEAFFRRQLLQLQTIRPALDAGDVLFFDCRTIHYGLANTSQGNRTGKDDKNAGRRPMLYLNVSQSWFHDPKNWDDREKIFD